MTEFNSPPAETPVSVRDTLAQLRDEVAGHCDNCLHVAEDAIAAGDAAAARRALDAYAQAADQLQRVRAAQDDLAARDRARLRARIVAGGSPALTQGRAELARHRGRIGYDEMMREVIRPAAKTISERSKTTPKRTAPRARTQRPARRGTAKTAQDPGDSGDPDPDPIERRVQELVDLAPPLSAAQGRRLAQLLGGVR